MSGNIGCLGSLAHLVVSIALVFYKGLCTKLVWNWHATKVGLPAIGIATAIGLAALAAMLTYQLAPYRNESDRTTIPIAETMLYAHVCNFFICTSFLVVAYLAS